MSKWGASAAGGGLAYYTETALKFKFLENCMYEFLSSEVGSIATILLSHSDTFDEHLVLDVNL